MDKEKAEALYEQGARLWREGDVKGAMTLYAQSAELDPDGAGATALEMARSIMDFRDESRLNP